MHFSSYNACSLNNSYLNKADKVMLLMRRLSDSVYLSRVGEGICVYVERCGGLFVWFT